MPDLSGAAPIGQPGEQPGEQAEPEFATPMLRAKYHALRDLGSANVRDLQSLARQGVQVDPVSLMDARFNILCSMLFDVSTADGQAGRLEFDMRVEQHIASVIADIKRQITQAKLAQGAQLTPQQVEQMARMQGLVNQNGHKRG